MLLVCDKVLDTGANSRNKPLSEMEVAGIKVKLVADSGSPYTIINKEMWNDKLEGKTGGGLQALDICLESFKGETIQTVGFRVVSFKFKGRYTKGKLYASERELCARMD